MLDLRTRVMVITGNDQETARVVGLFNAIGYLDTEIANSAPVAIRRLHNADRFGSCAAGLVYLDWVLQGQRNGQELLSIIRSDYKIKLIAIVMAVSPDSNQTAFAREQLRVGLLDGWVLKPPTQETLAAALAPIEARMIPPFNV
jgi:hypothetical protein